MPHERELDHILLYRSCGEELTETNIDSYCYIPKKKEKKIGRKKRGKKEGRKKVKKKSRNKNIQLISMLILDKLDLDKFATHKLF